MPITSGCGARPGSIPSPAVHSLWTPVWNQCVRASTAGSRDRANGAHRGTGERPGSTPWGGRNGMADATLDLATVWDQIRERLATSPSPQQNAMLTLTRPLGLVEDTAVLAAPNEFTQTVLESRMRRVLAEALSEQFGRDIRVAVQLEDAPADSREESREEEPTRRPWSAVDAQRAEEDRARRDRADDGRSAFGVRTDAVRTPPWDREANGDLAGLPDPEVRELRPVDGPAVTRSVDRGAPEDWSTTTWGPGVPDPVQEAGFGARDWGGADDGETA